MRTFRRNTANLTDAARAREGACYVALARMAIMGQPRGMPKPSADEMRRRIDLVRSGQLRTAVANLGSSRGHGNHD